MMGACPIFIRRLAAPPALELARLNWGQVRLNLPFFKWFTCNHRIFIDKKYKSPILTL
jgi:hypothetical protein